MSLPEAGSQRGEILINDNENDIIESENQKYSEKSASNQSGTKSHKEKTMKTKGSWDKLRDPVQRQGTFTIANYRYRKSISQIDMKLARRNGLLHYNSSLRRRVRGIKQNEAAQNDRNELFFSVESDQDQQIAGLRIYSTFLLNAWRKRRNEVSTLTDQVNQLKKFNVKVRNQVHVLNTLFNIEKESNKKLNQQLQSLIGQNRQLRESESYLKTTLAQSERSRYSTDQQLRLKIQDHNALTISFEQTQNELYSVMSDLQETRNKLNAEQSKVKELEEGRLQTLKDIEFISERARQEQEDFQSILKAKETELSRMQAEIEILKVELANTKETDQAQICNLSNSEQKLKTELETLQHEVKILRNCLAATMGQRIRNFWRKYILMQRTTTRMLYWFAAFIMPALPPPTISNPLPFNLTLEKATNVIKR